MKIAQIAPIIERVPPKKYGGTERMIYALTEELVKRGHEVTLFASGDSITTANLSSVYPRSLREARFKELYGLNKLMVLHVGAAYTRQDEFDIIHEHNSPLAVPVAQIAKTPVVFTIHNAFDFETQKLFQTLKRPYIVTISKAQAEYTPNINLIGTIYHGLDMRHFPFSSEHDGYLLYVGRISLEKGVHHAIETALYLNLPLIIAAKLEDMDAMYFKEYVGPFLSENIKWIGEVNEEERNKLMSRAMCFLHPVTWREPFGLTLIEAMACGCPVVAFNKGSIPEIIIDGETGFVVNNVIDMIEAVLNIGRIDRLKCREYVLKSFSPQNMADGYEKIYKKILENK